MGQSGEPSVEEILASIKKVIARDNRVQDTPDRVRREPLNAAALDDSVLDLADAGRLADEDELADDALLTGQAVDSMRESLAALSVMAQPGVAPQIVRSGETSLEGLTRDLLRPMLADWLDTNLPPLVERLVAAEIARIVGKKL